MLENAAIHPAWGDQKNGDGRFSIHGNSMNIISWMAYPGLRVIVDV